MKKLIAFMLAFVMILGCFAGCGSKKPQEGTLAEAAAYLHAIYKDAATNTPADYDLIGKVLLGDISFSVTWTVGVDVITIKESETAGMYTVDVPSVNDAELSYVLTATITDADGNTETKSYNRCLPVIDRSSVISEPEDGVAYKLFMNQVSRGEVLYATLEASGGRFIVSTKDAKEAPDFFGEKADGGYKFYAVSDGVKYYLHASLVDGSKVLSLVTENACVWTYHADVNAWMTGIGGADYVVGTYSSYNTFCISEATYITPENSGVSQFPLELVLKEDAESAEVIVPEIPTTLTAISEVNTLASALENKGAASTEKYLVLGVITSIANDTYGNMNIADANGNSLYVYGVNDENGSMYGAFTTEKPVVGDVVTLCGVLSNYNGPQMKSATLISFAKPSAITDINSIASALENKGASSDESYLVTGVITSIANETYGNINIADAEGNSLYVYGVYDSIGDAKYGDMTEGKPVVGDTVTLYGVLSNYNGPQMKNAKLLAVTASEGGEGGEGGEGPEEPTIEEKTIAEINTIASALENKGAASAETYMVTGVIVSFANETYGNAYIVDGNGDTLYVYGINSADGKKYGDITDDKPLVGDMVVLTGVLSNYNGPQMKNATLVSFVSNSTATELTSIGEALENKGPTTEEKYLLVGIVTEITNDKYGNGTVTDLTGNTFTIYGMVDGNGGKYGDIAGVKPVVGDTVALYGVLSNYNGAQMKNGEIVGLVPAAPAN